MSVRQRISEYRAGVRKLKARIRRDEKRLETEQSHDKCRGLEARIFHDQIQISEFESRIHWLTE